MPTLMEGTNPIAGLIPDRGSVSVTADGVKTRGQLLTELNALVDYSKVDRYSKLKLGTWTLSFFQESLFSGCVCSSITTMYVFTADINAHTFLYSANGASPVDGSNIVQPAGETMTLYY